MKERFTPTFVAQDALNTVGRNIRAARLRRSESVALLASRLGVSPSTVIRMEAGEPGVAAGALLQALITYGFDREVFALADPDSDEQGKRLDMTRVAKRGRTHAS